MASGKRRVFFMILVGKYAFRHGFVNQHLLLYRLVCCDSDRICNS